MILRAALSAACFDASAIVSSSKTVKGWLKLSNTNLICKQSKTKGKGYYNGTIARANCSLLKANFALQTKLKHINHLSPQLLTLHLVRVFFENAECRLEDPVDDVEVSRLKLGDHFWDERLPLVWEVVLADNGD